MQQAQIAIEQIPVMPSKCCGTCRYASSRVAAVRAGGSIEALCLNSDSPYFHDMMKDHQSCPSHAENSKGAVDEIWGNPYDPNGWEP